MDPFFWNAPRDEAVAQLKEKLGDVTRNFALANINCVTYTMVVHHVWDYAADDVTNGRWFTASYRYTYEPARTENGTFDREFTSWADALARCVELSVSEVAAI